MSQNRGLRAFSWIQIDGIRARYAAGESQGALAREYRVNINTIGRIVRGETYNPQSRTGVEPPLMARAHYNPDDPTHVQELQNQILRDLSAVGIKPDENGDIAAKVSDHAPTPPREEKHRMPVDDKAARLFYSMMGRWPEGYTPPEGNSDNQLEEPPAIE